MNVTVVIISYNTSSLTLKCISSIKKTTSNCPIIVVDNCSPDSTVSDIRTNFNDVNIIITPENRSYANAVNIGMNACMTDFVIVCNADVEFRDSSIQILTNYLKKHPKVGVVAPQQIYPNGSWQRSYGYLHGIKEAISDVLFITTFKHALRTVFFNISPIDRQPKYVDYVDGAILAIRRDAHKSIEGFDEEFSFYSEESDFCYRLKQAYWDVVFNPKAVVMHIRGASSGSELNQTAATVRKLVYSKVQFVRKHRSTFGQKIYIALEYLHFSMKKLIYSLIILVHKTPSVRAKLTFFERISSYWKEYL